MRKALRRISIRLIPEEAARRLEKYGPNELEPRRPGASGICCWTSSKMY